ncbi:HT motif family protein [Penguinpox virus]|uniref:HT motif family protein n=1 Tax=Penguinpox virus TaxID=648998 RepID=A0A068EGX4_9POXV|nr:HT motif family protein [Penguinpox virus]AID46825.1 HT motif family protein [Penguinpox virus]
MEFDISSCRMIYSVLEQYHFVTDNRYNNRNQKFRIVLYCLKDSIIKRYPYRFVSEIQFVRYIINKFRGKNLYKISIEAIDIPKGRQQIIIT